MSIFNLRFVKNHCALEFYFDKLILIFMLKQGNGSYSVENVFFWKFALLWLGLNMLLIQLLPYYYPRSL